LSRFSIAATPVPIRFAQTLPSTADDYPAFGHDAAYPGGALGDQRLKICPAVSISADPIRLE
jgi:hypothetical protein